LEVVGLKAEKTQINIAAPEFCGILANTACSNTTEAKSRQHSLHVGTTPTAVTTENTHKLPRFRVLKLDV